MPLQRTEHWATRELHSFLLERAGKPFEWGVNDCCLFPADAIEAFTGVDLAAEFRGRYTSEAEAFALIKSVTGAEGVEAAAAYCAERACLLERTNPLMAQRGDLVVLENEGRMIAGIVHLNGRQAVTVAEDGLVLLPLTAVRRAWAV